METDHRFVWEKNMGRNRHPEQTLEKIVDISAELFAKKGYEQTSIQDILDATGLSKGGLYHHFKSKDDKWRPCSALPNY